MTTPQQLFALQELDHRIDHIDAERNRVEQRLAAGVNRPDLTSEAAQHREQAAAIRTNMDAKRDDGERLRERLSGLESRLYNTNTSRRDLSAIQREADSTKYQITQNDEQLAEMEQERRSHETAESDAREQMQNAESEWQTAIVTLNARLSELAVAHGEAEAERATMAAELPAADLTRYERLRHNKAGTAVALVDNGRVCLACRMLLPRNVLRQLRDRTAQVMCSTCGRILYQQ